MGKTTIHAIHFFAFAFIVFSAAEGVNPEEMKTPRIDLVHQKLKLLNKPPIKTIHSEDGDTIDCVDIYKQPAFDHPALKNHQIQMKPSFELPLEKSETREYPYLSSSLSQTWHKNGSCPEGTIPIRRIKKEDLLRASSLDRFGRKSFSPSSYELNISSIGNTTQILPQKVSTNLGPEVNRSTAILVTAGYNYIGATGDINVWNPSVDAPNEYTLSQIWLKNGPGDEFESVEAGWAVNPLLYGDRRTRLTLSWTVDAYKSTGCIDLTCSGFIQTDRHVALGSALEDISGEGGPQYVLPVAIVLDNKSGNWWVAFGKDKILGYWPGKLFKLLSHSAILVEWGGEVYSSYLKKSPHTKTAMGSGEFASLLEGNACFVKRVRIMDYSQTWKYPRRVGTYADEPYCYSAYNYHIGYTTEPLFFFGGPGRHYDCP